MLGISEQITNDGLDIIISASSRDDHMLSWEVSLTNC